MSSRQVLRCLPPPWTWLAYDHVALHVASIFGRAWLRPFTAVAVAFQQAGALAPLGIHEVEDDCGRRNHRHARQDKAPKTCCQEKVGVAHGYTKYTKGEFLRLHAEGIKKYGQEGIYVKSSIWNDLIMKRDGPRHLWGSASAYGADFICLGKTDGRCRLILRNFRGIVDMPCGEQGREFAVAGDHRAQDAGMLFPVLAAAALADRRKQHHRAVA